MDGTASGAEAVFHAGIRNPGGAHGIVGIAASLGGLDALSRVLADLPADFPLPILVAQHLRRGQPSVLPGILRSWSRSTSAGGSPACCPASWRTAPAGGRRPRRTGTARTPGVVHVAPPDWHLLVRPDGALGLSRSEPENFCRPSADVLFRSLAEAFGPRAVAVVLTGLGRDGARGVEAVARADGATIAQDGASAEAADMPHAAVDIGRADLVLPLDRIGFALTVLAGGGGRSEPPRPLRGPSDRLRRGLGVLTGPEARPAGGSGTSLHES